MHLGYLHMPFDIPSGHVIWQRTINTILHVIPGVSAFINDIIITSRTRAEHLKNV